MPSKGPLFDTTLVSPNVLTVRFNDVHAGWEQWVLLRSDAHHDNAQTDQAFELTHLEEAKRRQALVLDLGDLFDAMQGPGDKRGTREQMRNEHSRSNYFDRLVESAAEFYGPYADRLALIALGNHETAVTRYYATNLTDRLTDRLRTRYQGITQTGGYGGWVRFMFTINKTVQRQVKLKYFHGAGGGGPVTRGVIQSNRQAVYLPDADIVWNGHTHDSWILPIARERLTKEGRIWTDLQHHVRSPTYKQEYGDGAGGYHVEGWRPPKPIGAVWMRIFRPLGAKTSDIEVEFTPAVK